MDIARKLALGVAAAHAKGVIHRDLKPQNVLWDAESREVLITDFGLARMGETQMTTEGQTLGTPNYMSPEQARGKQAEVGPPADVYSLGVIFYRLLTDELPFQGSTMEVLAQAQFAEPRPPSAVRPGLDPRLDVICLKAMAKKSVDRFPSAKSLADALAGYLRAGKEAVSDSREAPAVPTEGIPAVVSSTHNPVPADPHAADLRPASVPVEKPRSAVQASPVPCTPKKPDGPKPSARRRAARQRSERSWSIGAVIMAALTIALWIVVVGNLPIKSRREPAQGGTAGKGFESQPTKALNPTLTSGAISKAKQEDTLVDDDRERQLKLLAKELSEAAEKNPPQLPKVQPPEPDPPKPTHELPKPEPKKSPLVDKPRDLLPGEKEEMFVYVIDGLNKNGTRRVLTLDIGGGRTMEFVRIPKGSFLMGAPDEERSAEDNEKPQRRVELTQGFYLGKFEVTQAQYQAVSGYNPSHFRGDRLPVESVSWKDAMAFCGDLEKRTGRRARLPSEAEWEYTCRAGTTTPFHFGSNLNGDLANHDGNYPYPHGTVARGEYKQKTTEVGSYPANPWGLHDMHGNVWEWCRDSYEPYSAVPTKPNPIQLTTQARNTYVIRGGAWYKYARYCRAAIREENQPEAHHSGLGFRVLIPLD